MQYCHTITQAHLILNAINRILMNLIIIIIKLYKRKLYLIKYNQKICWIHVWNKLKKLCISNGILVTDYSYAYHWNFHAIQFNVIQNKMECLLVYTHMQEITLTLYFFISNYYICASHLCNPFLLLSRFKR